MFKSPATIIFCSSCAVVITEMELCLLLTQFYHSKTDINILQLAVDVYDKTHIRLYASWHEWCCWQDHGKTYSRSSQALRIFSLFNSSSLLPDPASLVTHYRGVADGFPLTKQKTGWNCVQVHSCLRETERLNQAVKTNILLRLLSTMNFDVYSLHWSGIPPVKMLFLQMPLPFLSRREMVQSCWARWRKKTNTQQTIS